MPVNPTTTITTGPPGLSIVVDGTPYTSPHAFQWIAGTTHTIGTTTPQSGATGVRYAFSNWDDSGPITHTIAAPSANATITALFVWQFYLTTVASPSSEGTVTPGSGWYDGGTLVQITATPNTGNTFTGWTGSGPGSYTGSNDPTSVTINAPISETASFGSQTTITFQTSPAGLALIVSGVSHATPFQMALAPGSTLPVDCTTPQPGGTGIQFAWTSWSDAGLKSHTITVPSSNTTYTANFTTQYLLTMNTGTGGSVSPSSGWYNGGQSVQITGLPSSGYGFNQWTGSGTGSYSGSTNPATITMNGPITETANFVAAAFSMGDTVMVVLTTDCVNARSAPSVTGTIILKCEPAGTKGAIVGGPTIDINSASNDVFYRVYYSDGITGWSASAYLEKAHGPLPIQLSSFIFSQGLLQWTTMSEVNNYGFYVQLNGEDIRGAFIPGHGTTVDEHHYSFRPSVAGNYRLRQADLDGTVTFTESVAVSVVSDVSTPIDCQLAQNWPNPFNPSTVIRYGLPCKSNVSLAVYNALGQAVGTLVNGEQEAGYHEVKFDGTNLASGMYFYRLQAGTFVQTKRLLLLR